MKKIKIILIILLCIVASLTTAIIILNGVEKNKVDSLKEKINTMENTKHEEEENKKLNTEQLDKIKEEKKDRLEEEEIWKETIETLNQALS